MSMQLSCEVVCPASRCRISNFACLEFVWAAEEVDFEINFKVNFKFNFEVNFQVNFKVNFHVNNFQVNFQVNVEANVLCSSIKKFQRYQNVGEHSAPATAADHSPGFSAVVCFVWLPPLSSACPYKEPPPPDLPLHPCPCQL